MTSYSQALLTMDKFTKEKRSAIMRAIRSRDTQPELIVRKWLYAHGWRFRCQYKRLPGHPDIAIPKIRTLIEIRGCFWHRHEGCPTATMPKTNKQFWRTKFRNNVARDKRHEKCEMGTVPRAKGGLRSCAAAEERGPPHFVRPRPPPPSYKSSIVTFRIVISSPPSLSAHLQLIYGSSPAHLSFTPLW